MILRNIVRRGKKKSGEKKREEERRVVEYKLLGGICRLIDRQRSKREKGRCS